METRGFIFFVLCENALFLSEIQGIIEHFRANISFFEKYLENILPKLLLRDKVTLVVKKRQTL
ncbi:hypothetical protein AWM68_11375 [Fictibacillus phosphorivorans]|uniref:Uncharacterized protein n=1 Tax=Fictibacillus phosphorivorans TaxID=1221500 RepID=A0A163PLZ6_9BACL|nr:hypothetical protein AWM68_11375 [Fictibacillus phosphorivorans]